MLCPYDAQASKKQGTGERNMKKIAKLGLNVLVLALAGLLALTGCSAKSAGELTQTILQAVTLPDSYSIAYEVTDAAGGIRTVKKAVDAAGNVYFADGEQELLFLRQQELAGKRKKLHIADEKILKETERVLYEEFAYVLGIGQDEVLPFILQKLGVQQVI